MINYYLKVQFGLILKVIHVLASQRKQKTQSCYHNINLFLTIAVSKLIMFVFGVYDTGLKMASTETGHQTNEYCINDFSLLFSDIFREKMYFACINQCLYPYCLVNEIFCTFSWYLYAKNVLLHSFSYGLPVEQNVLNFD